MRPYLPASFGAEGLACDAGDPTPGAKVFQPDRDIYLSRLETLISNAFAGQWAPEKDIDWSLPVVLPEQVPLSAYIDMVSQLYYAEEATIALLGEMMQTLPDFQARQYVSTQAIDEARHAWTYRAYLERLGDIAPINEGLRAVLEGGLAWSGSYCGQVVALNVLMEGQAIEQQHKRVETLPCPLFRKINEAIIRDEARHCAFGKIYMKHKLPELPEEERVEIFRWIGSLWKFWNQANQGRYDVEGGEILITDQVDLGERWLKLASVFVEIGLIPEDHGSAPWRDAINPAPASSAGTEPGAPV